MRIESVTLERSTCSACGGPRYFIKNSSGFNDFRCNGCKDLVDDRAWIRFVGAMGVSRAVNNWETWKERCDNGTFLLDRTRTRGLNGDPLKYLLEFLADYNPDIEDVGKREEVDYLGGE